MKILVFSDSHGYTSHMLRCAENLHPDTIIHLGDGSCDVKMLKKESPHTPVIGVRGNCDFGRSLPEREIIELSGHRLFICHGHVYGVKLSLDSFLTNAMCAGADVALYGHTHVPDLRTQRGILILNPGSIGRGPRPSCALLTLEEGRPAHAELITPEAL